MDGFFPESYIASKVPDSLIPNCGRCKLYESCESPKMEPTGRGRKNILIVGEAPGGEEDKEGIQFVGKTGRLLERALSRLGINMRRDCWLHNALACHPEGNETPTSNQINWCRPNLNRALQQFNPHIIIPLGGPAIKSVIGSIWKEDPGGIGRWAGWNIPYQGSNTWICPTYHPSYVSRQDQMELELWFMRHLKRAISHKSRPWKQVPNYIDQVQVEYDISNAAAFIRHVIKKGGPCAFDYETNMLKPDSSEAAIVSCSISWKGKKTIAFPWHGTVIDAMRDFLKSPVPKIASNIKFEHRWSEAILDVHVNNWVWDTMTDAHILDNRTGITSIKFQGFVLLGVPSWDDKIKPYLQAKEKGGNNKNRIHEINPWDLLIYNGMDSLVEILVAKEQAKRFGMKQIFH